MQVTRSLPTFRASAQQPAPPQSPTPEPPAADDSADRYTKAAVHALNGVSCIMLGGWAMTSPAPLGMFYGGIAGMSGGGGYGHVADILANALNMGTFNSKYALPGALIGGAAGAGAAYLAAGTGNPLVGYALGFGCAVPSFLNAVRAYNGLD